MMGVSAADGLEHSRSFQPRVTFAAEIPSVDVAANLLETASRRVPKSSAHGSSFAAYPFLEEAMSYYEKAESLRPPEDDDAILRWNTCARTIMNKNLRAQPEDDFRPMLE